MHAQSLNAAFEAIMPCSNTFAELNRKSDDDNRSADQIKFDEDKAINKVLKFGNHCNVIAEAISESAESIDFDRIRDAALKGDDLESGRIVNRLIRDYAKSVAQANGNL